MTETGLNKKVPQRQAVSEPKPRPEPKQLTIEPQVFAHVVEAMHTLAQQQPQIAADVNAMRAQLYEYSVSLAGLMEDIAAIATAVGVRPGPMVLRQQDYSDTTRPAQQQGGQQFNPPQGQQHASGRPTREQLAQTLRAIPGVNETDKLVG